MQNPWGHLGCVGLVALTALTRESGASYDDQYEVHWVDKDHHVFRHPKRDSYCQQTGWSLCPDSAGSGCCPGSYECGDSSCYATTAGPTTACGRAEYFSCPLTAGAGSCCPVGYICGSSDDCAPPDGQSLSCPTNYFACPSSLGYGCCQNGKACGDGVCYDTTPTTLPVSSTLTTTDSNGDIITTTITTSEVITPGPDLTSSAYAAVGVPKLIPSTVSKLPASTTDNSDNGNNGDLTAAALGGIIAGVIVLLLAIVAAAVFIIRRLRKTERAAQAAAESRRDNSTGQATNSHISGSHKSGFGQPSISEVDGVDVDPLKRRTLSPHMRSQSDSSIGDRSQSLTPNFMITHGGDASSRTSSPPTWGQGIFNTVPPSDASNGRQSSLDTYGGDNKHDDNNTRYSQQTVQRVSYESQVSSSYTGHNGYHWSNVSEVVGSENGAHGVSELDANDANDAASRRRSSSSTRPGLAHVRRSSDPAAAARSRSESSGGRGAAVVAQPPLGTVSEIPLELHGYYGPKDLARGQTAARLAKGESSVGGTPGGSPS
ncbi:hypothetical protein F5X99DRAFT_14318 [Biscogniauxia marginata]|nr:hypothetical protein F5X99DRAFT_14318 [Biscogniauxia marginata]